VWLLGYEGPAHVNAVCGPGSRKHKQRFTSKQANAVVLIFTGREVRAATQDQGDPTTSKLKLNKETRFCTNFPPLVFVSPRFMQKVFLFGVVGVFSNGQLDWTQRPSRI
jgi:hypothetical protein